MLVTVVKVALTNLLLSSDNVLMIALLSGGVVRTKRIQALLWSLIASLLLQLGILFLMAYLFHFSFLRGLFGVVICIMAFQLVSSHHARTAPAQSGSVGAAIARITLGNLMMSFENEAALITLAQGNVWVGWIGILITAPLIFFGSHLMVSLLRRYSLIVDLGAVYLFLVGSRLLFAVPWLHAYAAYGVWALMGAFAVYVAAGRLRGVPARG